MLLALRAPICINCGLGGVNVLRYYLLGAPFVLITDHAPLKSLNTMRNSNARLMCWYLTLQQYAFTIKHWAGKENANTDFFSRLGGNQETSPEVRELELRGGVCACSGAD